MRQGRLEVHQSRTRELGRRSTERLLFGGDARRFALGTGKLGDREPRTYVRGGLRRQGVTTLRARTWSEDTGGVTPLTAAVTDSFSDRHPLRARRATRSEPNPPGH